MSELAAEIAAIKQAYAALNQGDIPAMMTLFDAEVERVEPPGFPMSGTYHGIKAVTEHFVKARATWAEGSCKPSRFITAGDKVIVLVDIRVRLKTETEWRQGQVADAFAFRGGKALQFRTFTDEQQALHWAGVA